MVPPPNELCGTPGFGLVPDQEIRGYIQNLGPAALKPSPTEAIKIEHFLGLCLWAPYFPAVLEHSQQFKYSPSDKPSATSKQKRQKIPVSPGKPVSADYKPAQPKAKTVQLYSDVFCCLSTYYKK
ncbi:hypothetical protein PoB_003966900 [Plakobranchus ocellatus]|uniref:Uncharacterized protein n=1 Tax=Plakobranchus ocellatus TaxID=259542 RepID=A0AAV4B3C8_9GAST|nr:hypothetical protein PoB_003966900 [Plakobranchus ocellatus]